jgi:glucosylceramidase
MPVNSVKIVQTSQAGDRLTPKIDPLFNHDENPNLPLISINPSLTFQKIIGFGGAFTQASAYVLSRISPAKRDEVLNAYFSPNGSHYSLTRTHINSCDFSLQNYSYDEVRDDFKLEHFDIEPDLEYLIPLIKDAQRIPGADFKILASPWSPPAWMKDTGVMNGAGSLREDCYGAWALYFSKYIRSYAEHGIEIWAITTQNEPAFIPRWDGCKYTAEQQRDFIKNNLGPRFAKDGIDAKILIWDFNKNGVYPWAKTVLSDPRAARYTWGTAFHWYSGDFFEEILKVHREFPDKHLLHTEGCQERGPHINEYGPAEHYGHDIIGDLNNWTEGWIDWNIVLDENGGPNHANNMCSAPIMADIQTDTLIYNPSYYYLTHFSKYIRPEAVRVETVSGAEDLEVTAFKNPDGKIVMVVMNRTDAAVDFQVKLRDETRVLRPAIPGHAIMTLIIV